MTKKLPPKKQWVTKDEGQPRTEFGTGAHREILGGKGRFDLLFPLVEERLAGIMERGAAKYGARNWENGMPVSSYLDSAKRHLNQFERGLTDEDHLGQCIWNLSCLMHTLIMIEAGKLPSELDNLPYYLRET